MKDNVKEYKEDIENLFWNKYKKAYCEEIAEVYRGNIGKKENFLDKCLSIEEINNKILYKDLLEEYKTLYKNELKEQELIEKIEDHQYNNPIKNSYEILWDQLRKEDYNDESNLNNMRRILEQYFHTIGNGNPNNSNKEFINKFNEEDRLIVKSLLSFVNDGSHSIMEGLYMAPDINLNQNAFRLFRKIFKELGHINHYKMMMQEEIEE